MEFGLLIGAALLSLVGALFHGVAGHRWHTFTIMLLVGAGTLAFIAYTPAMKLMAYPIILTNAAGALMFLVLGLGSHRHLLKLPGLYLMGGTATLALLGIY